MALLGGILIGIASTILWGGIGRITGISGITGSVLTSFSKENNWRLVWLLGLLTGGIIMLNLYPSFFNFQISSSPGRLIIAGLLVGFGTRLGSGCTSGHGVCGLGRMSVRSLISVMAFMFSGIVLVAIESFFLPGR